MRQISLDFRSGAIELLEVPAPMAAPNQIIVSTSVSLMSAGTERMLLNFGAANWLQKIRQQPDRFRDVLAKISSDGLIPTLEAVRAKLDQPISLGYCNVGRVVAVGEGVSGFKPGERVVSNGPHAETVRVPHLLCAKVPDEVGDEAALFTVLSAIALQGIRLAQPTLGEHFVVMGLGLLGLLTCQLLNAAGCKVLGCDFDADRLRLARDFGAETFDLSGEADPVSWALLQTHGRGADGVIVAASTDSNKPVRQAAKMSRQRGRIVLVGVAGLELARADFYEKEISFQVSCSYGPGRYDLNYEQSGNDYPLGFVRWTAQRNFDASLQMLASDRLKTAPLITHRYAFDDAAPAYKMLLDNPHALGIVLQYPSSQSIQSPGANTIYWRRTVPDTRSGRINAAFFGSGNYASRVLIPCFVKAGASLEMLVNTGSLAGAAVGRRNRFGALSTDPDVAFNDEQINTIVIATRHDSHAALAIRAIETGKHVFVEKPLSLTIEDLDGVEKALRKSPNGSGAQFCVGFNRRFAPLAARLRDLLRKTAGPKALIYTVNAGAIPAKHWVQHAGVGGGRIVGECCHFIDLLRYLIGAPISFFDAKALMVENAPRDSVSITLGFVDGSIGTVHYLSNGGRSFPKERIEVFAGGATLQLDNFRRLRVFGKAQGGMRSWRQDKGQQRCVGEFVRRAKNGGEQLIPLPEIFEVMRIAILAQKSIDTQ